MLRDHLFQIPKQGSFASLRTFVLMAVIRGSGASPGEIRTLLTGLMPFVVQDVPHQVLAGLSDDDRWAIVDVFIGQFGPHTAMTTISSGKTIQARPATTGNTTTYGNTTSNTTTYGSTSNTTTRPVNQTSGTTTSNVQSLNNLVGKKL